MSTEYQPLPRASRFARFPIAPACREGAWKAERHGGWKGQRHGDFQSRFDFVEAAGPTDWPFNCRYFTPLVMDPTEAMDLNARDTEYLGPKGKGQFPCIDFTGVGPKKYMIDLDQRNLATLQNLEALPVSGTRVLFLPQWRLYSADRSTIQLGLESATWENLLTTLQIPPNVVELLHENNGGSWQHFSYCKDNPKIDCEDSEHRGACAYHICFKASQFEMMYARYDFHSKRNLILVMGVDLDLEMQRLTSQFRGLASVHLFHVLLAVLGTWLQKLEQSRSSLDFDIMQLEKNTSSAQLVDRAKTLQQGHLSELRTATAGTQGWIRSVARHSACLGEHFRVLEQALPQFRVLQSDIRVETLEQQLLSAIGQYQSQQRSQANQAHELSTRIDTQWNVLVTLLRKRDSDVTIDMARDARTDSIMTRKMTAVSIIFLPATFLAAFFSMMFFQVDESGGLSINRNIWVYFATTIAMSLLTGRYFRFDRSCKSFASRLLRRLDCRKIRNVVEDKV